MANRYSTVASRYVASRYCGELLHYRFIVHDKQSSKTDTLRPYLNILLSLFSVVFPQDLLENGLNASNFAMLGLGDIVIPGIFIALLLRFDMR